VVSASVGGGVSYSRGGVALSACRTLTLASGDEHQTRPSTEHENGPLWTASVGATDASVGWKSTVGILTVRDTWRASERRTLDAASVAKATDASVAPEKRLVKGQQLYSFVGL
jgi:hypothetical protein